MGHSLIRRRPERKEIRTFHLSTFAMRLNPNVKIGGPAWCLVFVLLSLAVARLGADSTEDENALSVGHPDGPREGEATASPEEEDSWGWSAGGWLSLGGWSSSWRSMVSATRSRFSWRFGNVPPEEEVDGNAATAEGVTEGDSGSSRCEELTMDTCRDLGYNATAMPNLLGHESQDIARVELTQFVPLVRVNCAGDMAFFLCALHAPRCTEVDGRVAAMLPPCRPMCERIKSGCNVVMERFHFEWPSIFECDKYPDPGQGHCTGQ